MPLRHSEWMARFFCVVLLLSGLAPVGSTRLASATTAGDPSEDHVTILITDSGLGGLSVTAELEQLLTTCHPFRQVRLVFANALPASGQTYNALPDMATKAAAFSRALDGFADRYHPNLILIACNTLSVVYPETDFAHRTQIPVRGIVETGAGLIARELAEQPHATAIILGTPTTIGSRAYERHLAELGVSKDRIVSQPCELLETEIQSNPTSDVVAAMIDMYAREALENGHLSDTADLTLALCCTHYGYVADQFQRVFDSLTTGTVRVINPNTALAQAVLGDGRCDRYDATATSVEVISAAKLEAGDITAVSEILAFRSTTTAAALRTYEHDSTLFTN